MYNNAAGPLQARLTPDTTVKGPFVPTAGITQADGLVLVAQVGNGSVVTANLNVITQELKS